MSRALVVVPCFNEAQRLNLRAYQDYARQAGGAELLFVNDGSRDETPELLAHLHANHPQRLSYLHLVQNSGKAEAVRQGVLQALGAGVDYIGFWDADLATPLADIDTFCRVLDTHPRIDLVIGTRLPLLGHRIVRRPLRHYLGRIFANTASLALGLRIVDTQCGAKLFRVTDELARIFSQPFHTRWIFDVELLARMSLWRHGTRQPPLGESIYELPLDAWRDVAGSTVKSRDFVKAIAEMARIYWTYLRPGVATPEWPPLGAPHFSADQQGQPAPAEGQRAA